MNVVSLHDVKAPDWH